jgi:hypothetical protein
LKVVDERLLHLADYYGSAFEFDPPGILFPRLP